MKKNLIKHILPFLLILMLVLPMCFAYADESTEASNVKIFLHSVEAKEPIIGAELQVWKVADYSGEEAAAVDPFLSLNLTHSDFADNGEQTAEKIDAFLAENEALTPDYTMASDESGYANFNLPDGVYFIRYAENEDEQRVHHRSVTMKPFIIAVPTVDETGAPLRTFEYRPKCEVNNLVDITVRVVWDNPYSNVGTPTSVIIELYDGDTLIDTVVVTAEDGWTYEWWNLPANGDYHVVENPVPSGYTVSYDNEGLNFVVTNVARDPSIPSTGDNELLELWVWVGAASAVCLITVIVTPIIIRKKQKSL